MWLILGVFSGTYLLRAIVDLSTDPSFTKFTGMLSALTVGILNDFFALMLILVLHYGNFSESNQKEREERLRDSFEGMSEDNDETEVSVIFPLDSNLSESQRNSLNIEEFDDQNIIAHSPKT